MIFATTFDLWRRALDLYLSHFGLPPLALSDMPAGFDTALQTWYGYGVRARVLAEVLVTYMPVAVDERIATGWE